MNFNHLFLVFFFTLSFLSHSSHAFSPTVDPRLQKRILTEDDQVSLSNPLTQGEFQPRISGRLSNVSLKFDDKRADWVGLTSDRGVVQAWGRPFLGFQPEDSASEMDSVLRRFIQQNYEALQVTSGDLRLEKNRTKFSGPYRYITYSRYYRAEGENPYSVEHAFLTFRFKFGALIEISNYTFGRIPVVEPPTVSTEDAIDTMMQDAGIVSSHEGYSARATPMIQPYYNEQGKVQFRFVYQSSVRNQRGGFWRYSVNGSDGRIVQIVNLLDMAGHVGAEVYPRMPGDSIETVSLPETAVRHLGEAGRTDGEGNYSFDPEGTTAELSGARAVVRRGASRTPSQGAGADGEILFSASENLSENMAYYFVNRINQFARLFVKSAPRDTISGRLDFLNSPITLNTRVNHPVVKRCNAWFDPQEKSLNFLEADEKCEASSQFSDIIFHEWGHAFDDALGGIEDRAFSEGVGDVVSALMTGDSRIGPGFVKGVDRPIRDINDLKVYPTDRSRDPHLESLILSGAWFETLQTMKKIYGDEDGRMKTAEVFIKHLVSTESYLDSYMGALTIDDDNGNLSDCTPHMCVLNIAFARRGIAVPDPRCVSTQEQTQVSLPACGSTTVRPPRE